MFSSFSADTEEEYQTEFTFIFPNFNWQTGLSWVHNVQSQKLIYLISNEINEILRVFFYLFPFYIFIYILTWTNIILIEAFVHTFGLTVTETTFL